MTSHENTFAISLNASIRNVNSVWQSIVALKEALDRKIPSAFRMSGLAPKNGNVANHDLGEQNADNSDLCIKWAWAYPVKTPTRGKASLLGHLYCYVALTPSHIYANYESTFQPYIAFWFDYGPLDSECDWDNYYLDHDHPDTDQEQTYISIDEINIFPSYVICQQKTAIVGYPDELQFWVYYPLNHISSTNIDTDVINPLVKAIKTIVLRQ
jgi:hypothetical protein